MDNLEDFIKKNKGEFDNKTPAPDMWKRIQAEQAIDKVVEMPARNRPKFPMQAMKMAASFLILALAAFGTYKLVVTDEPSKSLTTESADEFNIAEVDAYYQKQVNVSLVKVEALIENEEILNEVREELKILDSEKARLMTDYDSDSDKKEVVQALMNTYRMKLQVLENIVSLLDEEENEENQSI